MKTENKVYQISICKFPITDEEKATTRIEIKFNILPLQFSYNPGDKYYVS